ncbi:hypothetical protein XAPC_3984 [Xanthomonas citri pv. punicae str. LMG 859]|nr:hypothetical protein XAPC_3984 [Xanthomonas citri pv. punicae str. LMG 859]
MGYVCEPWAAVVKEKTQSVCIIASLAAGSAALVQPKPISHCPICRSESCTRTVAATHRRACWARLQNKQLWSDASRERITPLP